MVRAHRTDSIQGVRTAQHHSCRRIFEDLEEQMDVEYDFYINKMRGGVWEKPCTPARLLCNEMEIQAESRCLAATWQCPCVEVHLWAFQVDTHTNRMRWKW